jgi:hypothetical protein
MFAARLSSLSFAKVGEVPRLAPERAHHPHARQRLLQVGGDHGDPLARDPVGIGRGDPERERAKQQQRDGQHRDRRQLGVEPEQDHDRPDHRQRRLEQRHHAVETSWLRASTSLVRREISTPDRRRE